MAYSSSSRKKNENFHQLQLMIPNPKNNTKIKVKYEIVGILWNTIICPDSNSIGIHTYHYKS